jgi:hypothetical protein
MSCRKIRMLGIVGFSVAFLLSGCGSAVHDRPAVMPVAGKVTYKGKAVEGATVSFIAAKSPRTASGVTNAAGEYVLTTFDTGDGAVLGEHKVAIFKTPHDQVIKNPGNPAQGGDIKAYEAAMKSVGKAKVESEIPVKYAKVDTSKLVREVVKGEKNTFNFDLTD